jgi:hypothetical protein
MILLITPSHSIIWYIMFIYILCHVPIGYMYFSRKWQFLFILLHHLIRSILKKYIIRTIIYLKSALLMRYNWLIDEKGTLVWLSLFKGCNGNAYNCPRLLATGWAPLIISKVNSMTHPKRWCAYGREHGIFIAVFSD